MDFNYIATTHRYREEDLVDELQALFSDNGATYATAYVSNIDGLVTGTINDSLNFVNFLRQKLKDAPWEIRYLLRFIPIEKVANTNISEIKDLSIELSKKIPIDATFKIFIEKRHTNLNKLDIINNIAPFVSQKVDLTEPNWIILIEIIGKYSGISVIKNDVIFSSMIEKRYFE
ncbi:MAG TPA: THUMP domain-containing protein [Candidatus Nitrosocosmicus sp.]